MELNVVDQLSRRGYRFAGLTSAHTHGVVFDEACHRIFGADQATYDVVGVVLLEIAGAAPLVSPGYRHTPDEHSMRALWRVRRAALDQDFEAFIASLDGMLTIVSWLGLPVEHFVRDV